MINKINERIRILIIEIYYKFKYKENVDFGKKMRFRKRFNITVEKKGKVKIGKNTFFNNDCSINCLGKIEIGDNSIFGENVKIYDHNHKFNGKDLIKNQGFSIGSVLIGNNCWIGSNVTILKDSIIGDNCVIGAGTVINGTIEKNSIVRVKKNYEVENINFKGGQK